MDTPIAPARPSSSKSNAGLFVIAFVVIAIIIAAVIRINRPEPTDQQNGLQGELDTKPLVSPGEGLKPSNQPPIGAGDAPGARPGSTAPAAGGQKPPVEEKK